MHTLTEKAYKMELLATIREILKLSPVFKVTPANSAGSGKEREYCVKVSGLASGTEFLSIAALARYHAAILAHPSAGTVQTLVRHLRYR